MSAEFEEIVRFDPAFDRRDADPKKDYGIHGVTLRMVLKGPEGAVQFVVYTNWQLPHVEKETDLGTLRRLSLPPDSDHPDKWCKDGLMQLEVFYHPMPADLGYHSPVPRYEDQSPMDAPCEWLDGRPCYYDGSSLNAGRIYDVLVAEGSAGVWRELGKYYENVFRAKEMKGRVHE